MNKNASPSDSSCLNRKNSIAEKISLYDMYMFAGEAMDEKSRALFDKLKAKYEQSNKKLKLLAENELSRYLQGENTAISIRDLLYLAKSYNIKLPSQVIYSLLDNNNNLASIHIQIAAAEAISLAPEAERKELILYVLSGNFDETVKSAAARVIYSAPLNEVSNLILHTFRNENDWSIHKYAVDCIPFAPEHSRYMLVNHALDLNTNIYFIENIAEAIPSVPEYQQHDLYSKLEHIIIDALENSNISLFAKSQVARSISSMPEKYQHKPRMIVSNIILNILRDDSANYMHLINAAELIPFAKKEDIESLIYHALENKNYHEVQQKALEAIVFVPESKRLKLILYVLQGDFVEKVKKAAIKLSIYIPQEDKRQLLESEAFKKELAKLGVSTTDLNTLDIPLKRDKEYAQTHTRIKHKKTGSSLIIAGNRAIFGEDAPKRYPYFVWNKDIPLRSFLAWKKAYESYEFWKNQGFSHVPVAPIISFRMQKNGKMHVLSAIIGPTVRRYAYNINSKFVIETLEQMGRIKRSLNKLRIEHGHPHEDNFCIRFGDD